jgi:putative membrane protein
MLTDALLAYAHFLSLFFMFGMLSAELVLCRGALALEQVTRLARIDAAYGMAALAVLASGAARLIWGAKGAGFYMKNPVFHTKFGLFVVVGLLSIVPTVRFIKWRKRLAATPGTIAADEVKKSARLIHAELGLLVLIPLAAVMMARGIGH